MSTGVFSEHSSDPHTGLRELLLLEKASQLRQLEYPATVAPESGLVEGIRAELARRGLAVRRLSEPLSNRDFRDLGEALGSPMPETDRAVQPFVEDGVILNLVTAYPAIADTSLQPFSAGYLSLHSEGSGRPARQQPRYLALMCCVAGADPHVAQTVLTPMAGVAGRLDPLNAELLRRTRYRTAESSLRLLREESGRPVFSFRDFMAQSLEWAHEGKASETEVNQAIRSLLAGMYDPADAVAVSWEPGLLVVFDNQVFFHGRTAKPARSGGGRHLKRLRILSAQEC